MIDMDIPAFARDVAHEARRGPVTVYWRPRQAKVCKTRDTAIDDKFAQHIIGVYREGCPESWVVDDVVHFLTIRALQKAMEV
jgi:hypothetical protein